MRFSDVMNQTKVRALGKSGCGLLFLMLSMALAPEIWGQDGLDIPGSRVVVDGGSGQASAVKLPHNSGESIPTATPEAGEERSFVNDEPREMPGIMMGAIAVNLTIISVCFFLLWREWRKHKIKPPGESGKQSES